MSARKTRPTFGDSIAPGASKRDIAAAFGISTASLCEWERLAEVPEAQFEAQLAAGVRNAKAIIAGAPVPARGRVERAQGLYRCMSQSERSAFLEWVDNE